MRREMADCVKCKRAAALLSDLPSTTAAKALRLSNMLHNSHAYIEYYAISDLRFRRRDRPTLRGTSRARPFVDTTRYDQENLVRPGRGTIDRIVHILCPIVYGSNCRHGHSH